MATQKGRAAKFGVGLLAATNSGSTSIISTSLSTIQSRTHRRLASRVDLIGEDGDPDGICFHNYIEEITITVIPSSSTSVAQAITNQNALMDLNIGDKVNLVDTDNGAPIDGAYLVEDISNPQSIGQFATVDLTLRKYSSDLTATVA